MPTHLHSCGTLVSFDIPGVTPNLLHPDGTISFVACHALAVRRVAEGVQNDLVHRLCMALDMALEEADQQAERFGRSDTEVAIIDLQEGRRQKLAAYSWTHQDEIDARAKLAALEAKIAAVTTPVQARAA